MPFELLFEPMKETCFVSDKWIQSMDAFSFADNRNVLIQGPRGPQRVQDVWLPRSLLEG